MSGKRSGGKIGARLFHRLLLTVLRLAARDFVATNAQIAAPVAASCCADVAFFIPWHRMDAPSIKFPTELSERTARGNVGRSNYAMVVRSSTRTRTMPELTLKEKTNGSQEKSKEKSNEEVAIITGARKHGSRNYLIASFGSDFFSARRSKLSHCNIRVRVSGAKSILNHL